MVHATPIFYGQNSLVEKLYQTSNYEEEVVLPRSFDNELVKLSL
jgi:hypothetical protein